MPQLEKLSWKRTAPSQRRALRACEVQSGTAGGEVETGACGAESCGQKKCGRRVSGTADEMRIKTGCNVLVIRF